MKKIALLFVILPFTALACAASGSTSSPTAFPAPNNTIFDEGRTVYGFFPSPSEATYESVLEMMEGIGQHGDVVLVQRNIPWQDFLTSPETTPQDIIDIRNLMILASQNDLGAIFVIDPLNGLNRREFSGLPADWDANFANPDVRAAFTNYTLRILREFQPRYLGLASEINTYADAHPQDFPNFVSLYQEVYAQIKAESPDTQVFVTFQWDDLTNQFLQPEEDHQPGTINWEQVEIFEPNLDLWVISSYPFVAFPSGADIPADYYTPLLTRTTKPLAVAEGGFTSRVNGNFPGAPEDQVSYLNALDTQLGERLDFWIYLLLSDFNSESYAKAMRDSGAKDADITTLGFFASVGLREADGTPKPALQVWDAIRAKQ